MIALLTEFVIAGLIVLGAFLTLTAALGLFRLPDLYTRMHAASKAGAAGSGALLVAVALQTGSADVWIKCVLAIAFFFLTAPVAAHLLAKAALRHGQALPPPEGDAAPGRAPASDAGEGS
ncbi:MAG: monovalent cation/H(+) antiporter subunit G [Rhizobiaceae bacterium]|nr:monovalent cation/H(+) antiporter subunit G [Rhizobiaceae bacterium]